MTCGTQNRPPPSPPPPHPAPNPLCRAFEKALQHATRFCGAVGTKDFNAIDALQESLMTTELLTTIADDGTELKDRLAQYEVVVLMNLNPSSVSAAKSLIPSLNRFADDAIEEVVKILRAASAASVAASAGVVGSAMADE